MQKVLVVGLGEVGRPLFDLVRESGYYQVAGVDRIASRVLAAKGDFSLSDTVDILLLCYPCENPLDYVKAAVAYVKNYTPSLVIVNSSVPPGTTRSIARQVKNCLVAYSPVRGMPKNDMKQELLRWDKFVAGTTAEATKAAAIFFRCIGLNVRQKKDPAALELGKLLSTTYHAVKIAVFQEFHRLAVDHDVQLSEALELIADDDGRCLDKPLMFPDVIGGTCLMPNVQLLLDSCSFRSGLLNFIQRSNELRKEEIKASFISAEVKAIRDQVVSNDVKRRFLASTKDELRAKSPWDCNCRMCDAVASCSLAYTGGKWPCNPKQPHDKS